jgi:hypothetical protein
VWYEDQRDAHRQIYASDEVVDYQFMGTDRNSPITDGSGMRWSDGSRSTARPWFRSHASPENLRIK